MARPKLLKEPARLEVLVELTSKRRAFRMATKQRISIGRLFENLLAAEETRIKEGVEA